MSISENQDSVDGFKVGPERPKRRWERHDVKLAVSITTMIGGERSTFSGQAYDISIGGLRLFLTREVEPGIGLQMEFVLPYSSANLVVRGVIRNRNGFTHGVEFVGPTAEQQEMIERTCNVLRLLH